jgi:predicted site-specific integrase-resolvase
MATRTKSHEPEPLAFDLRTAARMCGVSTATLRRRSNEGALRTFRLGGKRMVCAASLRALLGIGGAADARRSSAEAEGERA